MKTKLFLSALMMVLSYGGLVLAVDEATEQKAALTTSEVAAPVADSATPVELGNTLCPVSGEEVGKMGKVVLIESNGKIYNLCCKMCEADFKKDPAKFSKIAEDSLIAKK